MKKNPFTDVAWTADEVNSWTVNFGVTYNKKVPQASENKVTKILVTVDYTPPLPPPTGTIVIVKNAVPNDAQDFAFISTIPDNTAFSLDDDGDETLSNIKTITNVSVGTYFVSETVPDGWDLTSATCDDDSSVSAIALSADEIVTCTFTNDDIPPPEEEDTTPPVSAFDNPTNLNHKVITTEIVSLNLSGQSTDESGIDRAEMIIKKIGNADSVSHYLAQSFFDVFNEIDCSSIESSISTEIVALSLTGANPTPKSWQHTFAPDPEDTGIYCFYVNAVDTNDNEEETAIAGPIAYIPTTEISEETISEINISKNSVTITWMTNSPSTSRVIYDTVSHATLGNQPNYGYAVLNSRTRYWWK